MESWYLIREGETYGPYSQEQMLSMVRTGHLVPDDLVCCRSAPEWVPAHTDARLFPDLRFSCPECGKVLKASFKMAGRRAECRCCGESVRVPESGAGPRPQPEPRAPDRVSDPSPEAPEAPEAPEEREDPSPVRLGRLDRILSIVAPLAVLMFAVYTVAALFSGRLTAAWMLFMTCSLYGSIARFVVSRWRPRLAFTLMKTTVTVGYGHENGRPVRYVARVETLLDRIGNIFIAGVIGFMTWLVAWSFLESYFAYRVYSGATTEAPREQWARLSKEPNSSWSVLVVLVTFGVMLFGMWIESR